MTVSLVLVLSLNSIINAATNRAAVIVQKDEPVIPLEGLDPVLLIQGKEVQGKLNIFITRGQYKYLFANEENKAAFEKSPADYEIQLEGTCARMGPQIRSNPDLFAVYKNHIYVFGSEHCQELFKATPEKYIEQPATEINATTETAKKGWEVIEKAVTATGGAAKIDGLTSYQESGLGTTVTQQGQTQFKTILTKMFPDRARQEQTRRFGTVATVLTPSGSFGSFQNDRQKNVTPLSALQQSDMEKRLRRTPLEVLRARKQSDFKVAFTGIAKVGEATVEQVEVAFSGVRLRLGVDAATGRILSLAYRARHQGTGEVGEMVQTFSDYRTVDGLTLPFKVSGTFNGEADPEQAYAAESISINAKVDPSLFEKPAN